MWVDVIDLRDFYASPLGRLVRRVVRRQLREIWPDVSGQRVLGMGFATPFLGQFREEAERVLAVMPPAQGVMHWPTGEQGLVALAEDDALPYPDRSMDRILLVHALESSAQFRDLLRECWRVLADGGRLVVVAPQPPRFVGADRTLALCPRPPVFDGAVGPVIVRHAVRPGTETYGALFPPPLVAIVYVLDIGGGARWPTIFPDRRRRQYRGSHQANLFSATGSGGLAAPQGLCLGSQRSSAGANGQSQKHTYYFWCYFWPNTNKACSLNRLAKRPVAANHCCCPLPLKRESGLNGDPQLPHQGDKVLDGTQMNVGRVVPFVW